ncbi:MAG: WYL domain-containing protein [Deltaproteobacteria bacterium]|nr:WYL domain-containing protein [Deltaproteobacteria bacterium]
MARATFFEVRELLDALRAHHFGLTYDEIESLFRCSHRTAQRWIKFACEQEWAEEVPHDDGGHKRWKATKAAEGLTPVVVNPTELLAQCLAIQAAAPLVAGTELHAALQSVTRKVATALPNHVQQFGVEALAAFPPPPSAEVVQVRQELLEDLLEATVSHRVLDVTYRPLYLGSPPKQYKLRPLAVFPHKGVLYVAAIGGLAEGKRPFYYAVHRFDEVTLTKEAFRPPKGFDARAFVQQSFGAFDGAVLDVRVRFSREVAPLVCERRFHHSQKVTALKDGAVDVGIQACGWPEIKAWILSFGRHAELLEPKDKRKELRDETAATARRYQP